MKYLVPDLLEGNEVTDELNWSSNVIKSSGSFAQANLYLLSIIMAVFYPTTTFKIFKLSFYILIQKFLVKKKKKKENKTLIRLLFH